MVLHRTNYVMVVWETVMRSDGPDVDVPIVMIKIVGMGGSHDAGVDGRLR